MPFAPAYPASALAWAAKMTAEGEKLDLEERARADAELFRRMAGGDRDALGQLYDRFSRPLYATVLHILRDSGEAEDVVHDVFLILWEKAGRFEIERGSAFSWAVTLARNQAIDRLRKRRRRAILLENAPPADLGYGPAPAADAPEESAALGDEARAVRRAVSALPPEQKRALELAFFSSLTQQEIAERLQEPLGTVKARIRRALLRLRGTLSSRL